jgi:uncharacterized membrane protein YgcG
MDKYFSGLNRRVWAAVAVSAAFLVPLGVFGAPALARSASAASEYQYSGSSQYQYKVLICHRTHSKKHPWVQISVGAPAVKAHLRHGDTLAPPCPPVTAAAASQKHGKSGDKGKSGDSHGQNTQSNGNGNGNANAGNGNGNAGNNGHGGGNGNGGGKGH